MNQKVKTIVLLGVFALFIVGAVLAYNLLGEKVAPPENLGEMKSEGEVTQASEEDINKIKAPDFTVWDREGNEVKLSDLIGKPIVLNFWASWCGPCREEMPMFDKVYQEEKDDIIFMMVDLVDGMRETQKKGEEYVVEQGFTFPVYFDLEQDAAYTYGITSIPSTLFIDKDGYAVAGAQGSLTEEILKKGIGMIQ